MSEIIYGRHRVQDAIRLGRSLNRIVISNSVSRHDISEILELARERGVIYQFADKKKLDYLANGKHQGIIAMVAGGQYVELSDLLGSTRTGESNSFLVLLDNIQDPRNLGAIIRTADAVQADGIIIPRRNAAGLTGASVKASAGTSAHMPVARVGNMNNAIQTLRENGFWLIGLATDGPTPFNKIDYRGPVALIIGGEDKGIRPLVKRNCDEVVHLPMAGHAGSFNASVAAALVFYEVFKQRNEI